MTFLFSLKWVLVFTTYGDGTFLIFRFCFKKKKKSYKQNYPANILRGSATGTEIFVICVWDFSLVIINLPFYTINRCDLDRKYFSISGGMFSGDTVSYYHVVATCVHTCAHFSCWHLPWSRARGQCAGGRCRRLFMSDRACQFSFPSAEKCKVKQPVVPSGASPLLP